MYLVRVIFKDLEIWHSRVPNFSWTHFHTMLRVADENARYWYMKEANDRLRSPRIFYGCHLQLPINK